MNVSVGSPAPPAVWLLIDDRAGNRSQCLGVAEALGLDFRVRAIEYSALGGLPNGLLGASFAGLTASSRAALAPPWPDLVIAAGRRTAPVARAIKRRNQGATFLAQIMDPGNPGAADFDLIAQPTHDGGRPRPNAIPITGAPHPATAVRLAQAADEWRGRFEPLARPWIALIVGGATRRRSFTEEAARRLGQLASAMARDAHGSLLVSTSRRTGAAAEPLLGAIDAPYRVHRWGAAGDNPYFAYLALADAVVVTGDSVSMCCEACAVPVPVYIYAPEDATQAKHARLHAELFDKGYARPMTERLEAWSHPPLNAAQDVAREIAFRIKPKRTAPMNKQSIGLDDALYGYLLDVSLREPDVLRRLRDETAGMAKARMQISPEQGQFMALLVELTGARKALEVGTFTGYSALCVALALPSGGRLVACDVNEEWTAVAKRYWREAGVADRIELRLAPGIETLDGLIAAGEAGTFDFAFIDAHKPEYEDYFERVLTLLGPGGLACVDNVLWRGRVVDAAKMDGEDTQAIMAFNRKLLDDERVSISMVPIGDGLTLARKRP